MHYKLQSPKIYEASADKNEEEIDNSTRIVGDFNNSLALMVRTSRQKVNKEIENLNNTINQLDLIDIQRTLHPNAAENMFSKMPMDVLQYRPYVRPQNKSQKL